MADHGASWTDNGGPWRFVDGQWRTMALRGRTMALFEGTKSNQLYKNGVLNGETRFGVVFLRKLQQKIHKICFLGLFFPFLLISDAIGCTITSSMKKGFLDSCARNARTRRRQPKFFRSACASYHTTTHSGLLPSQSFPILLGK